MNNIKFYGNLATERNTTYLTITSNSIEDLAGNGNEVVEVPGMRASMLISDFTGPMIESFNFNVNAGVLVIMFDEVVDVMTAQPTAFTVVSGPGGQSFPLNSEMISSNNRTILTIQLSDSDLNAIKAGTMLYIIIAIANLLAYVGYDIDTSTLQSQHCMDNISFVK